MVLALFSAISITDNFEEYIIETEIKEKEAAIEKFIEISSQELENRVFDNAIWDDLFYNLGEKDHEWIEDNSTLYMYEEENFDIDIVFIENDDKSYTHYYSDVEDESWVRELKIYKRVMDSDEILSDCLYYKNHLIHLVASKVKDNNERETNGILILGRYSDKTLQEHLPEILGKERFVEISFEDEPLAESALVMTHQLELRHNFVNGDGDFVKQLVTTISQEELFNRLTKFSKSIVMTIGISSLLALILIAYFAKRMTFQLQQIILEIQSISHGQYDSHLKMGGIDELNLLARSINKLSQDMKEHKERLQRSYFEGIQTLIKTLETVDAYTRGHSERVAFYTVEISRKMGFEKEELENLRMAALMHDFGKIGIPSTVLNKPGKLTTEEFEMVKQHPMKGYEILDISHMFNEFTDIIKYHHERYDGNGYPMKISGEHIPMGARILAVADSFDAMTSNRAYRDALPLHQAMEIIRTEKGKQFDPDVVEIFLGIAEDLLQESNKLFGHSINNSNCEKQKSIS